MSKTIKKIKKEVKSFSAGSTKQKIFKIAGIVVLIAVIVFFVVNDKAREFLFDFLKKADTLTEILD